MVCFIPNKGSRICLVPILYRRLYCSLRFSVSLSVTQQVSAMIQVSPFWSNVPSPKFTTWESHHGTDFYMWWVKIRAKWWQSRSPREKIRLGAWKNYTEALHAVRSLLFRGWAHGVSIQKVEMIWIDQLKEKSRRNECCSLRFKQNLQPCCLSM